MVFQKAPFSSSKTTNNGNNSKNATTNNATGNKKAAAAAATTAVVYNTSVANPSAAVAAAPTTIDIYDDSGGFETSIINNNLRNGFTGRGRYHNTTSTLSSLVIIFLCNFTWNWDDWEEGRRAKSIYLYINSKTLYLCYRQLISSRFFYSISFFAFRCSFCFISLSFAGWKLNVAILRYHCLLNSFPNTSIDSSGFFLSFD